MTTSSRGRSSGSRGRDKGKVFIESLGTAQSSPSTPTTPLAPVTSQVGPTDQQFIMIPNPNYMPPFVSPPTDPATEPAVGDSSNASQQDAPPPQPVIRMSI
ncbi:uncharacterized protein DS421_13g413980 [Arachis hypogaea]|nr:uncharacterized protein DS421_13g413980 [Arachis hypogaea]